MSRAKALIKCPGSSKLVLLMRQKNKYKLYVVTSFLSLG